jgi:hypothetical protein
MMFLSPKAKRSREEFFWELVLKKRRLTSEDIGVKLRQFIDQV